MRSNGRKSDELRPMNLSTHVNKYAEGSVYIEMGTPRC